MTYTYLAAPIDRADSQWATEVVGRAIAALHKAGMAVFSPSRAWVGDGGPDVVPVNDKAVEGASALLAILFDGVPTIGVPMEIQRAIDLGMPVAVWTDITSRAMPAEIMHGDLTDAVASLVEAQAAIATRNRIARFLAVEPSNLTDCDGRPTASSPAATCCAPGACIGNDSPAGPCFDNPRGVTESNDGPSVLQLPVMVGGAGVLPTRGYPNDAGFDLIVSEDTWLEPGKFTDVPNDVSVQLPDGVWGMITGRSSTLRERGLLVHTGIIDTGYRGQLFSGAFNLTDQDVKVWKGERIAQLVLFPNTTERFSPVQVASLTTSERGSAGFGSTGR